MLTIVYNCSIVLVFVCRSIELRQLSNLILDDLKSEEVDIPLYRQDNNAPEIGIVHLGSGAFFRGHQAWYTHQAMQNHGGNWGISAVSMRSSGVSEALTEQNGLYSLAELDTNTSFQIIGSINEVLVAKTQYQNVVERLTSPSTQFVTLTITEKGYCLNSQGQLDLNNNDIIQDMTEASNSVSAIGLLVEALKIRWEAGHKCLCIISCDNITDNGKKLKAALIQFANLTNPEFSTWLQDHLICPCTMVDSITPATDDALRTTIANEIKVKDNWPIKRESFVQWVVEDILPVERPAWDKVGVILTKDVAGFENAKLRLLNCPHSSLAYLGVLMGIETVFDAMQDVSLVQHIEKMIDSEIIPSFAAPKELNATKYSREILDRFRNPAICHLLSQIAWDGSQKLPMRVIPIIEQNIKDGRSISLLCMSLSSWFLFIRKRWLEKQQLVDPLSEKLLIIASNCRDDAEHDVALFLSISEMFSDNLVTNIELKVELQTAYKHLLPLLMQSSYDWSVKL